MTGGARVDPVLRSSTTPLSGAHDLAMLDLDGVVYIGTDAVPGAAGHIGAARDAGMRIAFITNNASRPAAEVAAHLNRLDVPASAADVVTSAQAASRMVVDRWGAGTRVLCLGGPGLVAALAELDLVPVGVDDEASVAVSGYGPQLRWSEIMRAATRIRDGLPWIASNTDLTIPTPFGIAPGHGVLVDMVARFSGVTPAVAGKPSRPLLDETVRRVGGARPLMVGDRLDTDIEGAHNAGIDSLLVLTGVTGLPELAAALPHLRPSYLAEDLGGLAVTHPAPEPYDGGWVVGGWRGSVVAGALRVEQQHADAVVGDWWRTAACTAWDHLDATGTVVDITATHVPGPGDPAR